MTFVDIDLGWTNYVQLIGKGIPEFRNNVVVLDGDVPKKKSISLKLILYKRPGIPFPTTCNRKGILSS